MYFFTSSENKFSERYYPMGVFTPVYPINKSVSNRDFQKQSFSLTAFVMQMPILGDSSH